MDHQQQQPVDGQTVPMAQESMQVTNAMWPAFISWRRARRRQDSYTPELEELFEDYFMRFVVLYEEDHGAVVDDDQVVFEEEAQIRGDLWALESDEAMSAAEWRDFVRNHWSEEAERYREGF
jgi:hypothetical protein